MIDFSDVRGAIFDLDDTLLDNGPIDQPQLWLHARSRLAAVQEAAAKYDLPLLATVTPEENIQAFTTAATHSIEGAVWNLMYIKGLVDSYQINPEHKLFPAMKAMAARKNELHEAILREYGVEVPGATDFIKNLAVHGLANYLALATSAIERDIKIFVDKYDLNDWLPPERIISSEKVTRHKPDPECFDLAFKSLGLPESDRKRVLAFEDNPRGIQSAKAAGLFVCAITTRHRKSDRLLIEARPDLIADSYKEFNELLGIPAS